MVDKPTAWIAICGEVISKYSGIRRSEKWADSAEKNGGEYSDFEAITAESVSKGIPGELLGNESIV